MYQNWQKSKIPILYLILALIILFGGLFIIESSKKKVKYEAYDKQIEAAQIMQNSMKLIAEKRQELNIPIDPQLDPNQTGLIGKEFTDITTTLGNLEAKRTATNPAFAALMVRYFHNAGLEKGDTVAIGASGSFPSLVLASLSACRALELKPELIYSYGSSMYGANIPSFTFLTMLKYLRKKDILPYKPIAVSLGGDEDRAEAVLFEGSRQTFFDLVDKTKLPFIFADNLAESIQTRLKKYKEAAGNNRIKCFVNIGGASANHGNTNKSLDISSGLVLNPPKPPNDPERGLIFEYSIKGIPVIHLLNVRGLALKNGLPIDPIPLPKIGSGGVYYQIEYSKTVILLTVITALTLLVIAYKFNN